MSNVLAVAIYGIIVLGYVSTILLAERSSGRYQRNAIPVLGPRTRLERAVVQVAVPQAAHAIVPRRSPTRVVLNLAGAARHVLQHE
jgi:hypothetical protein